MKSRIQTIFKYRMYTVIAVALIALLTGCASVEKPVDQGASASDAVPEASKLVTGITTVEAADTTTVLVSGNTLLTYTSVKQHFPLGVLFYFPETSLGDIQQQYTPASDVIQAIEASELTTKGKTSRILITLKSDVNYEITPQGKDIRIAFQKPGTPDTAAVEPQPDSPPSHTENLLEETAVAPESTMVTAPPATMLETVDVDVTDEGVVVHVKADGAIKDFSAFSVNGPPRIVFDLYELQSPYNKEQSLILDSQWVKSIRHYAHPDKVRLVLDTKEAYLSAYNSSPANDGLIIRVSSEAKPVASTAPVETSSPAESAEQVPALSAAGPGDAKSAWVNRIDFTGEEEGRSSIVVGTTKVVDYDLQKSGDNLLRLTLFNTKLPTYRNRPLITTRFESAVNRISPLQKPGSEDTIFAIEMREMVPYEISRDGDVLRISFAASNIPPKPLKDAGLPEWEQVLSKATADTTDTGWPKSFQDQMEVDETQTYVGEKIALDFYDTDIRNVFRIIREISGKNMAIDKDVAGKVTLSLVKPVPWDQALDLVLRMNNLGMIIEGDIIRIAKRETLAQEKKALKEKEAARQKEAEQQKQVEPLVTEYLVVNYASAKEDILPLINQLKVVSPRGSITVDSRNNQLIVTDTADVLEHVRKIVSKSDKVTPQVIIEARVVEATKSFSRDIGTQWNISGGPNDNWNSALGGDLTWTMGAVNPPKSSSGSLGISFSRLTGTPFDIISATISASESNGDVKVISSPKIVTLNTEEANIRQGLKYPYNKLDADGNTVTEFQDVALELTVTPTVLPDNRIQLEIAVSNNEVGAVINTQQSFTTKEATTKLLVDDGDTVVIGGIVKTRESLDETGLPYLMDIPLLNWLFKTRSTAKDLEELLIFITPQIVQLEQRDL